MSLRGERCRSGSLKKCLKKIEIEKITFSHIDYFFSTCH